MTSLSPAAPTAQVRAPFDWTPTRQVLDIGRVSDVTLTWNDVSSGTPVARTGTFEAEQAPYPLWHARHWDPSYAPGTTQRVVHATHSHELKDALAAGIEMMQATTNRDQPVAVLQTADGAYHLAPLSTRPHDETLTGEQAWRSDELSTYRQTGGDPWDTNLVADGKVTTPDGTPFAGTIDAAVGTSMLTASRPTLTRISVGDPSVKAIVTPWGWRDLTGHPQVANPIAPPQGSFDRVAPDPDIPWQYA